MRQKLILFFLFFLVGSLVSTISAIPTHAAYLEGVSPLVPTTDAVGVPVDQLSAGITLKYHLQGAPLSKSCRPLQSSITNFSASNNYPTVDLVDQNHQHIPLYTISYSDESEQSTTGRSYSFSLKYAESGYELQPQTWYELRLRGGSSGIRFECSDVDQHFFLPDQVFISKFQTGSDEIAPIIKQVSINSSFKNAIISWELSDKLASSKLLYGQNGNYNIEAQVFQNPNLHKIPYAILNGLKSGEKYNFKIIAKDQAGNESSHPQLGSFLTLKITSNPIVSEVSANSARIKWNTNIPVESAIFYGVKTNTDLGSQSTDKVTTHDFRLLNLEPNRKYYFKIQLKSGNYTETTSTYSFTTNPDLGANYIIPINPEFTSTFDFSNFNFKDFPQEESRLDDQSSKGAVLAAQDDDLASISGDYGSVMQQYRWVMWLWVPILLLLLLISCIWMLHRHQYKVSDVKQEILRQKILRRNQPPRLR